MPSDLKPRTRSKKVANYRLYALISFGLLVVYLLYFISNSPAASDTVYKQYESATSALTKGRSSSSKAKSDADKNVASVNDRETHALVHELKKQASGLEVGSSDDPEQSKTVTKTKAVDKTKGRPKGEAFDPADSLSVLFESYPMILFSKTYCPYSKNAKKILDFYDIRPRPLIYELDVEEHGTELQAELGKVTGRKTVPNIIVNSQSIGGCDELVALDSADELVSFSVALLMTYRMLTN